MIRRRLQRLAGTRYFSSSAAPMVGFIGLGNMGCGMAKNLVKKGNQVCAFDVSAENLKKGEDGGIKACGSVGEVARNSDIIITMLRTPQQVLSVYDEIFENCKAGTLCIDSSTVDPSTSQTVHSKGTSSNVLCMDSPVSGGVTAAEAGTLTFMVGGPTEGFERTKAVLQCMGLNVYHCGANAGSGQIAKICNNLILGICMNAVGEGLSLGVKLGCDPKILSDIINVSSGQCWSTTKYNPCPGVIEGVPGSNNYNGGFVCDLMLKDLELSLEAAKSVGSDLQFGALAKNVYKELSEQNFGNKDFGIVYQRAKGSLEDENYSA